MVVDEVVLLIIVDVCVVVSKARYAQSKIIIHIYMKLSFIYVHLVITEMSAYLPPK